MITNKMFTNKLTTSTMKIYGALSDSTECRFSCGSRPGHGKYHIEMDETTKSITYILH
jgi:hypothetical protein